MLGWILAACLSPSPVVEAPLVIDGASIEYYEVYGATLSALSISSAHNAPATGTLRQRGSTTWDIRWRYAWNSDRDCDLSRSAVDTEITVTLPHWEPDPAADLETRTEWSRYVHALAEHERGHVALVHEHAARVRPALRAATCATADGAAQAVLDELRAAHSRYDEQTENGRKQGASLASPRDPAGVAK